MECKLTVKQMILNKVATHPKGYLSVLAEIAGYTGQNKGSNFNKVLTDEKKEFDDFNGLVKLVNFIWENDSIQLMVKYSNEVNPKKKTARNLLEYLVTNREFEAFNNLITKMESCSNKESQEWARVYKLQYKYELSRTNEEFTTLLREIGLTHITVNELKIYQKMLLSYCHNQLTNYDMVKIFTIEIDQETKNIENEYIKDSYTIRSNEIMAYNHLKVYNNPEVSRQYADKIISSNARPSFKAYANFIKGYSFLFTSYEKTVKYLNESIELYKSIGRYEDVEDLKEKVEFANIYWGKNESNDCYYIKNRLFLDINKGKDIKSHLEREKENIDSAFYLFLEGLNTNSEKKLILSLIKFIKKNDLFLANLSKLELLKIGYDEDILEELTGIKF